jgi:dolichol kinase
MSFFPKDEIKRKLFHFLSLIYAAAFWYLPKFYVLAGLAVMIILTIIIEITRRFNKRFNDAMLKIFSGIYRKSEEHKIAGVLWTLIGAFITIIVFDDKTCVLASFLYLALGDAAAALFGRAFGKHKIYGGKSIEGSVACFTVCLIAGLLVLPSWQIALAGAFLAAFIETIPWPLSDNMWMQIINAGTLTLLVHFMA